MSSSATLPTPSLEAVGPRNANPPAWREPRPNRLVMWLMAFVNRWVLLRGWFRVRSIRISTDDRARFTRLVNRETVAFIGPNHPEFGADWMMDKELSTMVAPWMAAWADRGIVSAAPKF